MWYGDGFLVEYDAQSFVPIIGRGSNASGYAKIGFRLGLIINQEVDELSLFVIQFEVIRK